MSINTEEQKLDQFVQRLFQSLAKPKETLGRPTPRELGLAFAEAIARSKAA